MTCRVESEGATRNPLPTQSQKGETHDEAYSNATDTPRGYDARLRCRLWGKAGSATHTARVSSDADHYRAGRQPRVADYRPTASPTTTAGNHEHAALVDVCLGAWLLDLE